MSQPPPTVILSRSSSSTSASTLTVHLPRSRKCRPGYKSPAKLARSREKAKFFHLAAKLQQENLLLKENNLNLKTEIDLFKTENFLEENIRSRYSNEMDKALQKQKDYYTEKHYSILRAHSENLKEKYKENFNLTVKFYKSEVKNLSEKLAVANQNLMSSNTRKAVYSPGKYTDNEPLDLRKDKPILAKECSCFCPLFCICAAINLSTKEAAND